MLPLKNDCKFKRVSFITSFCLPRADVEKEEHIIKLLCIDEADRENIVLIVFSRNNANFAERALGYRFEAWTNQKTPWEEKTMPKDPRVILRRLKQVFLLGISDQIILSDTKDCISNIEVECKELGWKGKFFRLPTGIFVQLPNFTLSIDQVKTTTEKWCYFLNHANKANQLDLENLFADDDIFKRAYEELDMDDRWSKEEIRRYELEMQRKSQQDDERQLYRDLFDFFSTTI
jgi:hypothetical protein